MTQHPPLDNLESTFPNARKKPRICHRHLPNDSLIGVRLNFRARSMEILTSKHRGVVPIDDYRPHLEFTSVFNSSHPMTFTLKLVLHLLSQLCGV